MKLLTTHNTKIEKTNSKTQYITAILHLAPHKLSGYNVCSQASKGCIKACLNTAGYGVYQPVQEARIKKTKFFFEERTKFHEHLINDLEFLRRKSEMENKKVAVRLNGISDIEWESIFPDIFSEFSAFTFYNYTKVYKRMLKYLNGEMPKNSKYVFSRSEVNEDKCEDVLNKGGKVAVVFKEVPKIYLGYSVTNGDTHDLIFKHRGPVLGLKAKGRAKKDNSGFVV